MPFWKRDSLKGKSSVGRQESNDSGTVNGSNITDAGGEGKQTKEKVDYKARLQHKQYLVSVM